MIRFSRVWAMPDGETFKIPPIRDLVGRWLVDPSVDPFARNTNLATVTNDLDPETSAQYHMDAVDFLRLMKSEGRLFACGLFDPPYSPRQVNELYRHAQMNRSVWSNSQIIGPVRDALADVIAPGGVVISCGWSSGGVGQVLGFEMLEVLLVPHGGAHSDTIVTVERKVGEPQVRPEPRRFGLLSRQEIAPGERP